MIALLSEDCLSCQIPLFALVNTAPLLFTLHQMVLGTNPSQPLVRAAQYLRMSTDHQECSIEIQSAAIALYAASHNMGIVRSYLDAGKSGLTIAKREGLKDLIRAVTRRQADFDVILVYDVSRWGRFQDVDESAHYEFICRRAGIQIQYCAEKFENDNTPTSNLLKMLKRLMAGEYSRELSAKVFAAQCRIASLGYWSTGIPPYGTRRQGISKDGLRKQIFQPGEQKNIRTDRVVLVPGPLHELADVRYIFDAFTKRKKRFWEIRDELNRQGRMFRGRPWKIGAVRALLGNPIFTGRHVFLQYRHQKPSLLNPCRTAEKIVHENAIRRLISDRQSDRQFEQAKRLAHKRAERGKLSNEQLLNNLRDLLRRKGRLTGPIITDDPVTNHPSVYHRHFGSLTEAYRLIGYSGDENSWYMPIERKRQLRLAVLNELTSGITGSGGTCQTVPNRRGVLLINGQLTVQVRFSNARIWRHRILWSMCIHENRKKVDLQIIVRLNPESPTGIVDYYVIPRLADVAGRYVIQSEDIPAFIDVYRTNSLSGAIAALSSLQLVEVA